jgi:nickel transport protein
MFKRVALAVVVTLIAGQAVLAHDTWIEKRNGELLVLRGHGGEVEAYDATLVKEPKALDANGQAVEIEIVKNKENASLSPKGKPVVIGALYDSGYWLKTTEGWKKATRREGKGKYEIVESIKSKQWCKGLLSESAENAKPLGQRFEVVPLKDPMTLKVGDKLSIKVVFDGKPVTGVVIAPGGGHASESKNPIKTDQEGKASVTIEKAGLQMVKAEHRVPVKDDPDADVLHLASTITFEIQ